MKLNQQLNILVEEAENYGIPALVMEKAVTPVLKNQAKKLKALSYHIMKNNQGDLLVTHLAHRQNPRREKKVVYAFLKPQDGEKFHNFNADLIPQAVPVTHLLLELFALEEIDSLIFLDKGKDLLQGTEIERQEIRTAILQQIEKLNPIYNA